jgi:hypothetical protein
MRLYLKDVRSGSPTGYDEATDQIVGYNRAMAQMEEYRIIDLDNPDGWTNDPKETEYEEQFTDEIIERGLFAMVRPQQTGVLAPGIGSAGQKEPIRGDENKTKLQDIPGVGVLIPNQPADTSLLQAAKEAGLAAPADDFAVRRGMTPTRSEAEKSGFGPTVDEEARSDGRTAEDDNDLAKRRERVEQASEDVGKRFNPAKFVEEHRDDTDRVVSGRPMVPGDEAAAENAEEAAANKAAAEEKKDDAAAARRAKLAAARKASQE